jgi:hypothetical protein
MHWGGAFAPPLCLPHLSDEMTVSLEAESHPIAGGFRKGPSAFGFFFDF